MDFKQSKKGRKPKEKRYNSKFAEVLRSLLSQKEADGINLTAVADELGITRQSLAQYRDGNNIPDIVILGRMADYFNVTTDYLLGRTEVMTSNTEIKSVCEFTGLSERSVSIMHEEREEGYGTNAATGINLLARYNEIDVLSLMQSYVRNGLAVAYDEGLTDLVFVVDRTTTPEICYNLGAEQLRQVIKFEILASLDRLSDKYSKYEGGKGVAKEESNNGSNNPKKE